MPKKVIGGKGVKVEERGHECAAKLYAPGSICIPIKAEWDVWVHFFQFLPFSREKVAGWYFISLMQHCLFWGGTTQCSKRYWCLTYMALTAAIHIGRLSAHIVMLCIFNRNLQTLSDDSWENTSWAPRSGERCTTWVSRCCTKQPIYVMIICNWWCLVLWKPSFCDVEVKSWFIGLCCNHSHSTPSTSRWSIFGCLFYIGMC